MSETNDCLICSEECSLENQMEYPNDDVSCKCRFHIHKKCSKKLKKEWANKCPLCFKEYETCEVNDIEVQDVEVENEVIISNSINRNEKCGPIIATFLFFTIQFSVIGCMVYFS
jgi:hypothetical protein